MNYELMINGDRLACTPENTTLYQHVGRLAAFDHIFVLMPQVQGEQQTGMYFFAESPRENIRNIYKNLSKHCIKYKYPIQANKREVSECDQRMFFDVALGDLEANDSFPENWL